MKKKFVGILFCFLSTSLVILQNNWEPLPDAKINFIIDGMLGIDVEGTISDLKSTIKFDPESPEQSSISASIGPSTINTKNKKRDRHLNSSDFLDVEKYPVITFKSKSFRKVGEYFIVEGYLTIKNVTKTIVIPFEFTSSGDRAFFVGDFNINRLDYGVGKKSILMGNEVRIHLNIPVVRHS